MATIKEWKHTNGYEVGETLPSVSPDDNGKVLGVSDGAWAVVSGGGGGASGLVVHANYDDNTNVTTLDKTWQEIWDVFSAGGNVVILDLTVEDAADCHAVAYVGEAGRVVTDCAANSYHADTKDGYPHDGEEPIT